MLQGALIAESLRLGVEVKVDGLRLTRLIRRDVSATTVPSQPGTWTFVEFEADDDRTDELAGRLAAALREEGGWYANFSVAGDHVVVFADRVFRYAKGDAAGREEVQAYGRSVGVPDHQLDWSD
jgi:hypothetical protein